MEYEHISILKGSITDEEVNKELENFNTFFEKNNITIIENENLGLRKLAYEIKKNKQGYYLRYKIKAEDSKISELENYVRRNENVIKFITVKVTEEG